MEERDPRRPRDGGQPHPLAARTRANREMEEEHQRLAIASVAAQTTRDHAIADACNAFTVLADAGARYLAALTKRAEAPVNKPEVTDGP